MWLMCGTPPAPFNATGPCALPVSLEKSTILIATPSAAPGAEVNATMSPPQQPAMPMVGFFNAASPGALRQQIAAFHAGLKESG